VSAREGVGALPGRFLTRPSADTGTYAPADGPRLGAVLADLVGALFAPAVHPAGPRRTSGSGVFGGRRRSVTA
jgi:hypothetical protein